MKTYILIINFIFSVLISLSANAEKRPPYADNLEKGIELFVKRQWDSAATEFQTALTNYPNAAVVKYNLALVQYKQKKYSDAIENFDSVANSKSYYRGPAQYYQAIAQMNLGNNSEALKIAKNYKEKTSMTEQMGQLILALENGTDTSYQNATTAEAEGNYELCLIELEESVLTDTQKGRELSTKCLSELTGEALGETKDETRKAYYKIYLDSQIIQSDNVFQQNENIVKKSVYFLEVGGEYLFRSLVDIGLGGSYNYFNGIDISNFKRETFTTNLPMYYKNSGVSLGLSPYYELNKYVAVDAYSAAGASFHATTSERKNYVYGIIGNAENRTALDSLYEYRSGHYNLVKLFWTKYFGDFSFNLNIANENTVSGDQTLGPFTLPTANKALIYGLGFSYDLTESQTLNLRGSITDRDYTNVFSPNGTDRLDHTKRASLTYYYRFNRYVRTFLQYGITKNDSNYDANEFYNRNFDENSGSFGLSLLAF